MGTKYICLSVSPANTSSIHTIIVYIRLSLSLPVYQVRLDWLPLPCIGLIRPNQLSCISSSVGRASASEAECHGFESHPSSSFFIFHGNRDVQVSCIALL